METNSLKHASNVFRLQIAKEIEANDYQGGIDPDDIDYYLNKMIDHMYPFVPQEIKDDVDWWNRQMKKNIQNINLDKESLKQVSEVFRKNIIKEIEQNDYQGSIERDDYDYYLARIIVHMYPFSPQEIKDDVDWWRQINKGFLNLIFHDVLDKYTA